MLGLLQKLEVLKIEEVFCTATKICEGPCILQIFVALSEVDTR